MTTFFAQPGIGQPPPRRTRQCRKCIVQLWLEKSKPGEWFEVRPASDNHAGTLRKYASRIGRRRGVQFETYTADDGRMVIKDTRKAK